MHKLVWNLHCNRKNFVIRFPLSQNVCEPDIAENLSSSSLAATAKILNLPIWLSRCLLSIMKSWSSHSERNCIAGLVVFRDFHCPHIFAQLKSEKRISPLYFDKSGIWAKDKFFYQQRLHSRTASRSKSSADGKSAKTTGITVTSHVSTNISSTLVHKVIAKYSKYSNRLCYCTSQKLEITKKIFLLQCQWLIIAWWNDAWWNVCTCTPNYKQIAGPHL